MLCLHFSLLAWEQAKWGEGGNLRGTRRTEKKDNNKNKTTIATRATVSKHNWTMRPWEQKATPPTTFHTLLPPFFFVLSAPVLVTILMFLLSDWVGSKKTSWVEWAEDQLLPWSRSRSCPASRGKELVEEYELILERGERGEREREEEGRKSTRACCQSGGGKRECVCDVEYFSFSVRS